MSSELNRRTGRRVHGENISVIVWDRARVTFLGTLDSVQWVEAITQEKSDIDGTWKEVEVHNQLYGHVSEALNESRGWRMHEFFVTFYSEGVEYSGYAVIRKPPTDYALLFLEDGFKKAQ